MYHVKHSRTVTCRDWQVDRIELHSQPDSCVVGSNPDPSKHEWCPGDLYEGKSQVQGIRERHRLEVSVPKVTPKTRTTGTKDLFTHTASVIIFVSDTFDLFNVLCKQCNLAA